MEEKSLANLAPNLSAVVSKRDAKSRTVQEALQQALWVQDIRGNTTPAAFGEFFLLWDLIQEVQLAPRMPDQHRWTPSPSGLYSSKLAYDCFFVRAVGFEPAERIWKNWAPPRCKIFIWLVTLNRCWTPDRLAKRGLDHPECWPLCDQQEETTHHLLVGCVFAKEVWFRVLTKVEMQSCAPDPNDEMFQGWWKLAECVIPKCKRKRFNSIVMLVA
jgi:hypothetical protein